MAEFRSIAEVKKFEAEMPIEDRWTALTVYDQLCETRDAYPNSNAVSFQIKSDPKCKAETLTYTQLTQQVTRAANLFRSLGVGDDDVVAYMLPTSNETLITMLGGMTAGKVSPLNPLLEVEQIAALLNETNAKVMVTLKPFPKTDVAQKAHAAVALAPCVETVIEVDLLPHLSPPLSWLVPLLRPKVAIEHSANVVEFRAALGGHTGTALAFKENKTDRVCALFHTGGTTGMPKIAQHHQQGILYNGWLGKELLYNSDDVVITPLPLFHVFAAYPLWSGIMCAGAHMVLPTPQGYRGEGVFDNFWKLCERWGASFMVTVPTAATMLMQRPIDADISKLKMAFCGSAPLPTELFKRFQAATGVNILEGYGMTEATCLVSCNPVQGEKKIGSVGIPFPYTEIRILDCTEAGDVNKECGTDEVGEICIYNHGVAVGHTYTDPTKNVGLFADEKYLRTGDLGRFDEDGYLWITGRAKDLIIRGGHNIDPAVIEEALAGHEDVGFVGAIGQPDAQAGELPCVYVELVEGATATETDLMTFAKTHILERAAVPKHLQILDELPKTGVGKIFKPDLRRLAIKRVFDAAFAEAGISATVGDIPEDKKRGLVAKINTQASEDEIRAVLGNFSTQWDIA